MAKEHLKRTYKLNKQKIKDHEGAMERAADSGNKKSLSYNKAHLTGHQSDNDQIKRSMKTANSVKPQTYNDVRKKKVAIMSKRADGGEDEDND